VGIQLCSGHFDLCSLILVCTQICVTLTLWNSLDLVYLQVAVLDVDICVTLTLWNSFDLVYLQVAVLDVDICVTLTLWNSLDLVYLQVAVLDVDICGPSMPKILGVEGEQVGMITLLLVNNIHKHHPCQRSSVWKGNR